MNGNNDKYELIYGTIGEAAAEIARNLSEHDYALVTEKTCKTWSGFADFDREEIREVRKRRRHIAYFNGEEGHRWEIATYKCKHKHHLSDGACWRFIDSIKRDGRIIARPKITIAAYEKCIKTAEKRSKAEAEYMRRAMRIFMMD